MRILVVDDSVFSRTMVTKALAGLSDIEIEEAESGIEALDKHRTFAPDIIFMDITMPHLDGITALKIIKSIDDNVRIVMISSLGSQKYILQDCTASGAVGILSKPARKLDILSFLCSAADTVKTEVSS